MTDRTVVVWDQPYVVSVRRKSKSVWVVVGEYKGASITVEDLSEGAAVERWCESAKYQGNG